MKLPINVKTAKRYTWPELIGKWLGMLIWDGGAIFLKTIVVVAALKVCGVV